MFGFGMKKQRDEELCRQYVRGVFAIGHDICPSIAETIQTSTQGEVTFPINDDVRLEISLAILGASLAILKGDSPLMPAERGTQIEIFCKSSIERDYDLPADSSYKLNEALDKYQDAFQKSMAGMIDPFGEISGIMLVRCLGPRFKELCLPGTSTLNLFIHQMVGGVVTLTITKAMSFWKGK